MNRRADKLIDAIGKVDDKYIRKSMPMKGIRSEINNEIREDITMEKTTNGLVEITVPKPTPKEIRNRRIKFAAVSGLAAAVVISGGVFVWNKLGGLKDPFNQGTQITSTTETDPDNVIVDYVPDVRDLKWGMTVEEVKAHETATLTDTINYDERTDLFYYPVQFEGYDTEMQLNVAKDIGFYNVIYNIFTSEETTGKKEDVYKDLYDLSVERYGLPDNGNGSTWASWYIPEKNTEFKVSLDENTNLVEYWVTWVHDTSSLPVMRGLKWGMTFDEVTDTEPEDHATEEEVESAGREQTLLVYNDVKYKDFNTELTLCVDKLDGLNGINYRIDTETYPDAFSSLKADFEKKYGKCRDNYGIYEWSMKEKNLTVMLMDLETTVQVGIFPYIDMSEDNSDTTTTDVTDPSGTDAADDMDISTWKQLDELPDGALPVYPSDLPKSYAEYETVGLPDWFDWDEFAKNGYPRVMLASFPNADADGKYDVYLLAASSYADADDENIVRGTMFMGIAEHGSDKFFALDDVGSDHFAVRMILDTNKIDNYLQIFNVKDENGENRMIIKTAYGENDNEYKTGFWRIKDGEAWPFYTIAGYVGSDPYVSDMEGRNMKLYSVLTQEGDEIIDNRNGMAFSFDFENDEIKIRTFTVADDGSSEDETPQPSDDGPAVKLKTFDIVTRNYFSHEINPGERSLLNPGNVQIAGNTAYVGQTGWVSTANVLAEVKDRLGDDYDSFEAAIKPYCNENGGLDFDKAWAMPSPPIGELFRDLYDQTPVQFVYKVLDDKWMINVNENGEDVSILMRDDKLTSIRRAAEYLWSVFDEYYDMTVTAIYNYDTNEAYLLVVSDNCPKINAAMQRDCAADVVNSCRFMTPGDIEPTWLPLTLLKESGGETYIQYIEQLDIYNVAFDNGVYSGASWESAAETADRLKQLGQPDTARTFLQEFGNMPETVTSQDELMEALHENIKSFERMIPYASLFDPVKLPRYFEAGFTFYYSVGPQVLEVMAEQTDSYAENYRIYYRLLQYSEDLTRIRYNVKNFRDNYTFNDPSNGFKGFTIKGIEVISVVEGLETKWQVRLIADESTWEEIERAYLYDMQLMPGDIVFASEPTDTSKLTTSIM